MAKPRLSSEGFEIWKLRWHELFHPGENNLLEPNAEQLAMRLQLSPALKTSTVIRSFLIIAGIFITIWLTIKIRWQVLILPMIIILFATAVTVLYCPNLFGEYYIHEGGEDGLSHQTYGRGILSNAMAGDWREVLRGGQDVYWDTPGFRYFRA